MVKNIWLNIKILIIRILMVFELCWDASDTWDKIYMILGLMSGVLVIASLIGEFLGT